MKHFRKKLSALVMSAVLLCGSITAAQAAQSRVIVRQLSPQCKTESSPGTNSCPDTKGCPNQQDCTDTQGCRQDQCESLCDLLSRCGLSTEQCEQLSRLMKQAEDCPGNTAAPTCSPTETERTDPTAAITEPTEQLIVPPTEVQSVPQTEAAAPSPTAAPTEVPAAQPTEAAPTEPTETTQTESDQTEAAPIQPTEAHQDESYALSAFEKEVITLVNIIRHENGLGYLGADAQLSRAARIKSQDMRDRGYFSHNSPTYGSPFEMMQGFGIRYRTAGENIAMGYRTPQAVVDGWMNSPGHRANILSENYTRIGVGYVADGNYWTQLFAG